MLTDREKRRLELEGLSPEELRLEFQKVFGEGAAPARLDKAVQTILDEEFGAKRKSTIQNFCSRCGTEQPHFTPGIEKEENGERFQVMECAVCGTWNKTYGGKEGEKFGENFDTPDNTDYSEL